MSENIFKDYASEMDMSSLTTLEFVDWVKEQPLARWRPASQRRALLARILIGMAGGLIAGLLVRRYL